MTSTRLRFPLVKSAAATALALGVALTAAPAVEVVILKDGFAIQGNVSKERVSVPDPATGKQVPIVKANGYDMVDEGPKVTVFSGHFRQVGEVSKEIRLRPDYKAYTRKFNGFKSTDPLPQGAVLQSTTDYNDNWFRKIKVAIPPNQFDFIEEQITYIDPWFVYMVSPTHSWRSCYRTNEFTPEKIRKLLSTHPDLIEKDGKPDAARRIAMAKFMLDAGWLLVAKKDLDEIKKLFPGGVPKEAKESFDKLAKEIDTASIALVIKEADAALNAGKYNYAAEVLAAFQESIADAKQRDEATRLLAHLKATRERYEAGRRLLRSLLDEVTGLDRARPSLGVAGGLAGAVWPVRTLPTPLVELTAAGEHVYAELHPDSAQRIDSFVNLAVQAERERMQGRDPTKKPDELLATVVSGWAMGKNGATPDPKFALKIWAAREAVLAYQRTDDENTRNRVLHRFQASNPVPIDLLAQVVSLLPPAAPENLLFRTGTPLESKVLPPGIYKRTTNPTAEHPIGIPYYVKLPPEYHHGRAYPVLIALGAPNFDVEGLVASLADEADRHGYIILAPDWTNKFGKGWQWQGDEHWFVTGVLREAVKNFCIDNDRVFMIGIGDGGNMALDIGLSHPDLFAGVVPICPIPKPNLFNDYWKNAQALPFYIVTGELAGASTSQLKHQLFDRWMPRGFPTLMTVYKGRGIDWYRSEVPVLFDWMSRKKRVTTTAVLKFDDKLRQVWQTMRPTDNRFYWLEANELDDARMMSPKKTNIVPASIQGDVTGDNVIRVNTTGVKKFSILLTADLIDWQKPVRVVHNSSPVRGYKPKVLEPDLEMLLEDYRLRGDRRVLLMNRLEFKAVP